MKNVSRSLDLTNFLFCNAYTGSNVTGDTNEYVISMDSKGLILIACYNADGDEARYCTKSGDYDTIVAGRGEYQYLLPNQIKKLISESIN